MRTLPSRAHGRRAAATDSTPPNVIGRSSINPALSLEGGVSWPARDLHATWVVPDHKVFLLSPARSDGLRAKTLRSPRAEFALAVRLREPDGAEIGEIFSFLSGLYFRGKLTYARAFALRELACPPILVITADRGLVTPETRVTRAGLEQFSQVDISAGDERYLAPLRRDVEQLAAALPAEALVVILGSIATGKYVDVLLTAFGTRLVFPVDFVGRGDMSRGGLLLRAARDGRELEYAPVEGAVRRGKRPPKLEPIGRK